MTAKSAKPVKKKLGVSKKIVKKEPKEVEKKKVSFAQKLTTQKVIEEDVNVSHNFDITPSKGILKRTKRPASPAPKKPVVKAKLPKVVLAEKENDFPVPDFDEDTDNEEQKEAEVDASKLKKSKASGDVKKVKSVGKKKLVVKKSVKEMLLAMTRKERKAFLKELQAKKKPNFTLSQNCKLLWEKLRSKRTSNEVKEECINKLVDMVKGNAATLVFAHDTARVIQCLIALKRQNIRDMLFEELKSEIVPMCGSVYGRYFVLRMVKYGTPSQRDEIYKAMEGHYVKLFRSSVSAKVLETIFSDFLSAERRHGVLCEFYGTEYVMNMRSGGKAATIKDIQELPRPKRVVVAESLFETLQNIVVKDHIQYSLTHHLLLHFFLVCTKEQRTEMVDLLKEVVPQFCHTREGSRAALYCIWHGSAKERKVIIKSFRDLIVNSCKDEFAHRVLLAIFDSVDDTALVNKFITQDLGNYIGDIIYEKYGQWVLHYVVFPRDYRFFEKGIVEILKEGDGNEYTKKAAGDRYREIFDALKKPMLTYMAANMEELLTNKLTSVLVLNVLEPPVANEPFQRQIDDEDKIACFKAIAKVAEKEYIPYDLENEPHIIEAGCGRFVLTLLLRKDTQQGDVKLSDYMADLPQRQLASFTAINNGCFILHYMFNSGSEKAKAAVKNAVKIKDLKKANTKGAILLLGDLSK
uniref:PUM-HD domain-containing protein n=1 Tax=Panagrolaimus sp. JU765 TaxID=591449 RepID=A0AC34RTK0_9BILA